MSKVSPIDAKLFKALVATSSKFGTEQRYWAGPDGFGCLVADDASVALAEWSLGAQYFKELPAERVTFGAVKDFGEAVKAGKDGEELSLFVGVDYVGVSSSRKGVQASRKVPVRDLGPPRLLFNDQLLKVYNGSPRVVVPVETLGSVLGAVAGVEGTVKLSAAPGSKALRFSRRADDGLGVDGSAELLEAPGDVMRAAYSLEYLEAAAGFAKAFETVTLAFGVDRPLFLEAGIIGQRVFVVVAPRV